MAYVLDNKLDVSEFEFQSLTNVHFRTYTLQKNMNCPILQAVISIVALLLFYKNGFDLKYLTKIDIPLKKRNETLYIYIYISSNELNTQ